MDIKVSDVKRKLLKENKDDLVKLICDLYKNNTYCRQYLSVNLPDTDNGEAFFQSCKKKLHNEFFPERGEKEVSLSSAKKIVSEYSSISKNTFCILDLMLSYVELGTEYTNTYGDIDDPFYSSMESMFERFVKKLNKSDTKSFYNHFAERLKNLYDDTEDIGWGYGINIENIYYQIKWVISDES